jgi:hypothetical protein
MAKNTTKTQNLCECLTIIAEHDDRLIVGSCGGPTARRFQPGHDARTKSTLQKAYRNNQRLWMQDGSTAIAAEAAKWFGYERYLTDAPKRKSRAKNSSNDTPETRVVKIGRWTYPLLMVGEEINGESVVVYQDREGKTRSKSVKLSAILPG